MTVLRQYLMIAHDGRAEDLVAALKHLADVVRNADGCERVDLLADMETPERITFIEQWRSIEAHKAGGKAIGRAAFEPVLALLVAPPVGAYLTAVD